jgi:hypothetical protein
MNLIPLVAPWVTLTGYNRAVINDAEGDGGPPTPGLSWSGLEPETDYTLAVDIESHTYGSLTIYAGNHNTQQTASQVGVTTLSFNSGTATTLNLVPSRSANMTLKSVELTQAA